MYYFCIDQRWFKDPRSCEIKKGLGTIRFYGTVLEECIGSRSLCKFRLLSLIYNKGKNCNARKPCVHSVKKKARKKVKK